MNQTVVVTDVIFTDYYSLFVFNVFENLNMFLNVYFNKELIAKGRHICVE